MKVDTYDEVLVDHVRGAFELAKADTLADAQRRAPVKTGKYRDSLQVTDTSDAGDLVAHLGSPLVSARAKEKGAYITAKGADYLVFNAGSGIRKVLAVRLRPQPTVIPAGRRFPEFMTARLREAQR